MEQQRYKVIIAEDDMHQLSLLKMYAIELDLVIISTVSSGVRLVDEVKLHRPDIVLLDIGLKKKDGISAFKEILEAGIRPQIIFVTGSLNPQHILTGYEFESVDYLTKPIRKDRFKRAIIKAKEVIHSRKLLNAVVELENTNWIILKANYRDHEIAENQIVFVEKDKMARNRCIVNLKSGEQLETTTQLKEIKEMCSNLTYSHRSYLVNPLYITSIQPDGLLQKSYIISLEHTNKKVPLTKKNYLEASHVFSKIRTQHT
ncbi:MULTISPECIES: LytTR family DNA-binding domain-containing protein [unclassified Paenibacillus]|uniref:LytR/AlgR family response regulator transcription factor n=1 Tax=Paenibacillus provencensis TaxID=441151 RepID=A0ABW3PZ21_9BACL|nr:MULTISPECIES: LytTR family DNA-binding domain-containing protein [unclassified Paenibacillus]MCM3130641.1 LytTR family DNA-binding domain-containing protein [Paenibacillus sp. MER 78]SDX73793.1 two component transcriptional regulator, LytTR family [Paenibacillus sp. PDC88]SFS89482.1 DNA-binding response regulator, LytR/AlgR family [Paenibacillus sp. 453mf]SGI66376.1 PhoP family transcriptional regulator [Mycobacterium tuberculosis]